MGVRGRVNAVVVGVLSRGRIRGESFRMRAAAHVRLSGAAKLHVGRNSTIEPGARIIGRADIRLGNNVYIGRNCTIVAFAPVSIGDGTLIAENVSIHTEDHGPPGARNDYVVAPIHIGADVWICAGAVITRGVAIGDRTTVGANAVVINDLPADALAAGVPAAVKRLQTGPE